jgi:hypothetical protein
MLMMLLGSPIVLAQAKSVDELVGVAAITRVNLQRIAVQQAILSLAAESKDGDGDGYLESPAMRAGAGPAGGGIIPLTSAAPKDDSYGTKLGYCAWDNGATGTLTGLIAGAPSNARAPVLAVVTAGSDNIFQTSCADIFAAVAAGTGTGVKGDDFAISYNTTQLKLGNSGSLYHGDPVLDTAALNALAAQQLLDPTKVVLRVGEVRITTSDNVLHVWNGSTWAGVVAAPSGPSQPWTSGTGGAYYSTAPIVVGADIAPSNKFTVVDTGGGIPTALQTTGQFNGTNYLAPNGSTSAFTGFDNTNNALILNAVSGAKISFQIAGVTYGSVSATGTTITGDLAVSGNITAGGSALWTQATLSSLSQLSNASTNYITAAQAPVQSVAGKTGNVVLNYADIVGAAPIDFPLFTGQVQAPMGSVSLPGYAFAGHADTGFYMPSAGELGASVNGIPSLRITPSSGSVVLGPNALPTLITGVANTALGGSSLASTTSGAGNVAVGYSSMNKNTTGSYNTNVGYLAGDLNNSKAGTSNFITLIGANTSATIPGLSVRSVYATAIGASANVTTVNTVVLGRPTDTTVIGATGTSGSSALLQVNGASQHVGIPTVSAPAGSAGMLYYDSTLGRFQFSNGAGWKDLTAGGKTSLSDISAAVADNAIGNGAFSQAWNWQLAGNTTGYAVGESTSSTGGTGSQFLMSIGTKAGSTASPLAVSAGGVEVFRINPAAAQILANSGTAGAPTYSFSGNTGTGLYSPSATSIALAITGTSQLIIDKSLNNFSGLGALNQGTTGTDNIAIGGGYTPLQNNSTGSYNLALGRSALNGNTTGSGNIALGSSALYSNSTGTLNVAIGDGALVYGVGSSNIALGPQSLRDINGSGNIGFGYRALASNIANYNLGIGYSALTTSTGDENIGIGKLSMLSNGSARYNVGIGSNTLSSSVSGGYNVGVGYSAGNGTIARTGTNSVFLGANTTNTDTSPMAGSGYLTLLGSGSTASGLSAANANAYMTAVGAGSSVTTINTIVLGRSTDKTVIGATGDNGSGNALQVTGGIQAITGNITNTVGQFIGGLGTAAAPTYSFSGMTSSGFYAPAINELGASVGGTKVMRIAPFIRSYALGADALTSATGYYNTAVGNQSLAVSTTGASNSALGSHSLFNNKTGGNNSAFGYQSMMYNTTGSYNSAHGDSSLLANTTGIENAATGYVSLFKNTTGADNTGVGTAALYSNTTGSYNVGVGSMAGFSNNVNGSTSNYITLIGSDSSASPGTSSSAAYMTAVGAGSSVTTLNTIVLGRTTDKTVIGATGDNGSGNALQVTGGIQVITGNTINTAGQFLGQYGSAAAPTFSFTGSPSTGLYAQANGDLMGSVAGARSLLIALNGNVAVGYTALANTGSTGNSNTALGVGVLYANTSGYNNTGTGSYALYANTTGYSNTANGNYALYSNTSGASNVAVGDNSLSFNSTGINNTASGVGSLGFNTTGSSNTASGFNALKQNQTGINNTAVGVSALTSNSGGNNTATGFNALRSNTTGTNNVANGSGAGQFFTTGSYNTLVGNGAGSTSVWPNSYSSMYTTLIGSNAYANPSAAGTAYMTAIGAGSMVTTGSTVVLGRTIDKTVIGATGDNGSGNALQVTGGIQAVTGNITSAAGQFVGSNGTVSAPTYSFASNTNTGFYAPSATSIALSIIGTNQLVIDKALNNFSVLGALNPGTTGTDNIAVGSGYTPMQSNTTGSYNIALGRSALTANTTGSSNIGLGQSALYGNTTGSSNVAIGNGAMTYGAGDANVALGIGALKNSSGSENIGLGRGALDSNTGNYNSAMGYGSLTATSGSENIAFGKWALLANGSAQYNVGIGSNALSNSTSGGSNVGIGYAAGNSTTARTGTNSVFLGANTTNADTSAMAGSGYVTLIGSGATASGLAAANPNAFMTALGAGSSVTTVNTIVLGRASDKTVIGATADNGSGNTLQVTGGIQSITGNVTNLAGQFMGAAGTATAPTYSFTGNTNTGLYMPAPGQLGASVNGILSLRIAPATNSVALGGNSLPTASTGTYNSAIGDLALASNTTGYSNTGVGAGVLYFNTSGVENTVVGMNAMVYNTTGNKNAAFGFQSLGHNTSGFENTSVGYLALEGGTTGVGNVGVGYAALQTNTTGQYNIGVGHSAGFSNNANALVSNYITLLGANTSATPGSSSLNAYMTAVGSGASVGTLNTVVLGRPSDKTVIGAVGDNLSGYSLQVTGGSQIITGNTANLAGQFLGSSGSVSAPAYSFNGQTKTGFYMPAAGQVNASLDGVRSMVLTNGVVGVGYGVLGVDSSTDATAIGYRALANNSAYGIANTAIGYLALSANTDGFNNSAHGTASLASNTTGYSNTAEGSGALTANTIGAKNTAAGDGAMSSNTTGVNNNANGWQASFTNVSGSSNTASGAQSLYTNASGSSNTAVGFQALYYTTASNNTAVGLYALRPNTTGTYNTGIGRNSGVSNNANGNTSSYITLIGAETFASPGASNAAAYMTAIGAGASVTTINTVVLGRAADSVAIGQTSAGPYQFTVNGTAGGTSAYAVASDRRFKQHIAALARPLDILKHLQGVSYEFNREAFPDRKFETGRQIGFIAQQIEPFVPEIVRTDKDGYKSVQYSQLVPLIVEGIKEQQDVLQHILKLDSSTLSVNIKTFQAQNVIVANFTADTVKVAALEADTARIKKLEADSIDAKSVRSDVVKTGETSVFVADGMFQPVFTPGENTQYLVNAVADDGSMAFASVAVVNGKVMVKPVNGTGLDIVTIGKQVGLVAASKKVKATWIRMS